MKEVNKDQFYTAIGPLNVHLVVIGKYPYRTLFKLKSSDELVGETRGIGKLGEQIYFLK